MRTIYLKAENNQLIETSAEGLPFEWDGTFYVYYGTPKNYKYNKENFNCFPIITISEDCKRVEDIEMFGCVDGDWGNDGELFGVPVSLELWSEVKPFLEMFNS
jgi:hypothetical protein